MSKFIDRLIIAALLVYLVVTIIPRMHLENTSAQLQPDEIVCTTDPHTKGGYVLLRADYVQFDQFGTTHYVGLPSSPTGEWCDITGNKTIWAPTKTPTYTEAWTCESQIGSATPSCSPGGKFNNAVLFLPGSLRG